MKKVLFIDRDGTLILEPKDTYQIDSFLKLTFYPGVFRWLARIAEELDYEIVMVTNQDGLGTDIYPEAWFWPIQDFVIKSFSNEGVDFADVHIDKTFPHQNAPTRKPGIAMLHRYLNGDYDLKNSFVIGDRITDVELAKNLGAKGIWLNDQPGLGGTETTVSHDELMSYVALETSSWKTIYEHLRGLNRTAEIVRKTSETNISVAVDLDGAGRSDISTGIGFLDHMLDQIARHSGIDLTIHADGDLHIDEHHTVEDVAITLGKCFKTALGKKTGISRYGFSLPMDEAEAQVLMDLSGRVNFKWKAKFEREKIGEMPTELFRHFFESLCHALECNLHIKAKGDNEHHIIEGIFKAFARALEMAVSQTGKSTSVPSSKGVL